MGGAKQVVDGLDGIKGRRGNFDKDGVPVAHCTVPKAGELEGAEVASAEGFGRDEASLMVDIVGKIEALAVDILDVAHKIDGIEVGGTLHHRHIFGIVGINLGGFEYLG